MKCITNTQITWYALFNYIIVHLLLRKLCTKTLRIACEAIPIKYFRICSTVCVKSCEGQRSERDVKGSKEILRHTPPKSNMSPRNTGPFLGDICLFSGVYLKYLLFFSNSEIVSALRSTWWLSQKPKNCIPQYCLFSYVSRVACPIEKNMWPSPSDILM